MSSPSHINVTVANPASFPSTMEPSQFVVINRKLRPNPGFEFKVTGMESFGMYKVYLKVEMVDGYVHKYKVASDVWIRNFPEEGREELLPPAHWIEHQNGEGTGEFWMSKVVDFPKLHFSLKPENVAIMLKTLRYYKVTLVIGDSNGNFYSFDDVRHSFRTVSKWTEKWAEFMNNSENAKNRGKRPSRGQNRGQNAIRRVARERRVRPVERMMQVVGPNQYVEVMPNEGFHQYQDPQHYEQQMGEEIAQGVHDQQMQIPNEGAEFYPMWPGYADEYPQNDQRFAQEHYQPAVERREEEFEEMGDVVQMDQYERDGHYHHQQQYQHHVGQQLPDGHGQDEQVVHREAINPMWQQNLDYYPQDAQGYEEFNQFNNHLGYWQPEPIQQNMMPIVQQGYDWNPQFEVVPEPLGTIRQVANGQNSAPPPNHIPIAHDVPEEIFQPTPTVRPVPEEDIAFVNNFFANPVNW